MYTIDRFGTVTLPTNKPTVTASPVSSLTSGLVSIGGFVFDGYGDGRQPQRFPFPLRYKAMVVSASKAAMRTTIDALRALVGTKAYLYRYANSDLTTQKCLARLVSEPYERENQTLLYNEITLEFLQLSPWEGNSHGDWRFDNGQIFDNALTFDSTDFQAAFSSAVATLTLTNSGNLPVDNAILTVVAGSGMITRVVIGGTGIDWQVDATITAGQSLVVDCGSRSVQVNGTDAYRNFSLGNNHSLRNWLYLEPGNTVITTTLTGTYTGAQVSVAFRDRWA